MADDDLEEMRSLRTQFQRGLGSKPPARRGGGRDADSDDDQEPTEKPAEAGAPQYKFGSTLGISAQNSKSVEPEDSEETDAMAKIMGFAGFSSGSRKSRTFDIDALVNDARKNAGGRSAKNDDSDSDGDVPTAPRVIKLSVALEPQPSSSSAVAVEDEDGEAGPPLPPQLRTPDATNLPAELVDSDSDFSDSEDVADDTSADWRVPCSYDLTFDHGDKAVSALTLDPVGARFATGSLDYEVKLWDFGGMQANLNPFRTSKPCESHAIHNLSFSNGGEQILVISGSAQAKVIDRDGFVVMECPKGFQFIMDMAETNGHISMLNSGWFSPKTKGEFCTCSMDGTVRLWSVEKKDKHKACIKPKSQNGRKTTPTTCAYSKDGKWIAAGCRDGSIQIWDTGKANFVAPAKAIRNAHANDMDVTSVCFSYDSRMICSRGLDDTVKLWDLAMLKKPVFEALGVPALGPQTDVLFSPNDKLVLTGTAVKKGEGQSKLVVYDRATWQLVKEIPVGESSVLRTAWHPKLNQIFASTAEGAIKVFFDPNMSHNGALLCRTSKKRRAKLTDAVTADYVYTPFALPLFKEEKQRSKHAQFERNRKDPVKSHRPELPVTGPGAGGRVGLAGGTLSSYLVRKLGYAQKMPDEDLDPRQALLRHAEEAAKNPYWVSPAYAKTQPKTIFQNPDGDSDGPASKKPKL